MKKSKRFKEAHGKIDPNAVYSLEDGVGKLKDSATAKFDESIEICMNLGVDPRHADQNIRGIVSLPFGTGKTKRVLVLTQGSKEKEAQDAGADHVGLDDYVKKIEDGWADVDVVVATPDVMSVVGKLGKILGPRGLMPTPKSGTVTIEVGQAVQEIKKGKIDFRVDKAGILHAGLGKISFGNDKIKENIISFLHAVQKLKPVAVKGHYVKKVTISSTMGPAVKLDHQSIIQDL